MTTPPEPPATGTATAPPPTTTPAAPTRPGTGKARLGQGELRRQVAAHLATHPSAAHTPGEVARALGGRSSGAVGNALSALTDSGHAERVSTKPQRYRATATTSDAARPAPPRPATRRRPSTAERPATPAPTSRPPTGTPAPAPTAPPPAPEVIRGPVTRPNGQPYHPRLLADLPDVAALRKLRAANIPALLYGPPGTGKTSLIEAAFPDLITVAGDGDTTVADLIGEYTQAPDGSYHFVYGPLVHAMTEGRCLLLDDATLISPKVLAVVYPAMDGRRQITVKAHKGETITAADGFYIVAGHNPGVHGAVLTEALASRFSAQIQVSTDYDLATTLAIDPRAVRVARQLAAKATDGEIGWAPQLRELIAFQRLTDTLGPDAAIANLLGVAPEEDRDIVAATIRTVYGRTVTPLSLGRQLSPPPAR